MPTTYMLEGHGVRRVHVDARMVERVYGKLAPRELGESIRRDVGPGRLRRVV